MPGSSQVPGSVADEGDRICALSFLNPLGAVVNLCAVWWIVYNGGHHVSLQAPLPPGWRVHRSKFGLNKVFVYDAIDLRTTQDPRRTSNIATVTECSQNCLGQYPRRGSPKSNLWGLFIATMTQFFGVLFTIGGILIAVSEYRIYYTKTTIALLIGLMMVADSFLGIGVVVSSLGMWALRS
jgi:hypothetical protein